MLTNLPTSLSTIISQLLHSLTSFCQMLLATQRSSCWQCSQNPERHSSIPYCTLVVQSQNSVVTNSSAVPGVMTTMNWIDHGPRLTDMLDVRVSQLVTYKRLPGGRFVSPVAAIDHHRSGPPCPAHVTVPRRCKNLWEDKHSETSQPWHLSK